MIIYALRRDREPSLRPCVPWPTCPGNTPDSWHTGDSCAHTARSTGAQQNWPRPDSAMADAPEDTAIAPASGVRPAGRSILDL